MSYEERNMGYYPANHNTFQEAPVVESYLEPIKFVFREPERGEGKGWTTFVKAIAIFQFVATIGLVIFYEVYILLDNVSVPLLLNLKIFLGIPLSSFAIFGIIMMVASISDNARHTANNSAALLDNQQKDIQNKVASIY